MIAGRFFAPEWSVNGTLTTTTPPLLQVVVERIVLVFPCAFELTLRELAPRELFERFFIERLDEGIGPSIVSHDVFFQRHPDHRDLHAVPTRRSPWRASAS